MNLLESGFTYAMGCALTHAVAKTMFSLKVIHREKLIEDGPCVIVANHQSFLDPPLLGHLFYNRVHFLARKTLFDNPVFGKIIRCCNAFPIDQEHPDPGSILHLLRLVRKGERVIVFPEGARTPDGTIRDAMPGIGLILSKLATVPVQPIRIEGAYQALPIHSHRVKCHPITISIGDPIFFSPSELRIRGREAQKALASKVMDAIRALPTAE